MIVAVIYNYILYSLHFYQTYLICGAGDYKMIHSCWSSEVTHSTCVCIFIRYRAITLSDALLVIATLTSTQIHSCGNSGIVTVYSPHVHVYIFVMLLSDTLLVIVSSTLIHGCGNSEVAHSSCVHIICRYTLRYYILLMTVGSTHLCMVVGMMTRYCWHEHYNYFIKYTFRYLKC